MIDGVPAWTTFFEQFGVEDQKLLGDEPRFYYREIDVVMGVGGHCRLDMSC